MKHIEGAQNRVLVPGKTFLVGEYLALAGGPSIVANTAPFFEFSWFTEAAPEVSAGSSAGSSMDASSSGRLTIRHPFHADSPAGRWLERAKSNLDNHPFSHEIQFRDPFKGKGGMGASTAEFAGAWIFRKWLENPADWKINGSIVASLEDHRQTVAPKWKSERFGSQRFRDLLDDYRQTTLVGSGADLVSQVAGGIAVWDGRIDEMRRYSWPFEDLAMTLVLTGKKLATHAHLAGLSPLDNDVRAEMLSWVEEAVQAFPLADADRFIASVRGIGKVLEENGRLADHSKSLLEQLADCSGVRAAKGCGAMGSDVLLILHDRTAVNEINSFCSENGLKRAAGDADICDAGLELELAEVEVAL